MVCVPCGSCRDALQARTDEQTLATDRQVRQKVASLLADKGSQISWTELHDALTSMRSHGKRIPKALTDTDLDVINQQVRQSIHCHLCFQIA